MKERLEDLCLKSSALSSSSMAFSSAPVKRSMVMKKSMDAPMKAMLAPKQQSTGFFKNVVSSVTNFFGGGQQKSMLAPSMVPRKQSAQRSRNIQMDKHSQPRMMAKKMEVQKQECMPKMAQESMMYCQMQEDEGIDMDLNEMMYCADEKDVVMKDMEEENEMKVEKKKKKKMDSNEEMKKEKKEESRSGSVSNLNKPTLSIEDVIKQQNTDGSFGKQDLLKQLFPSIFMNILSKSEDKNISKIIAITYAVAKWIEKNHPQKQYALIVKKALSFVKKSVKLEDLKFLDVLLQ